MATSQEPPPNPKSRRLPPPCWSDDETVALIHAYRDKWYSLRRGNLRAPHWQEVAAAVAAQCPSQKPPKTSIQCRHKMEKLRKRYRSEIQKPHRRHPSSPWIHFKQMDSMEFGSSANSKDEREDEEDGNRNKSILKRGYYCKGSIGNGNNRIGVRIRIPNMAAVPASDLEVYKCNDVMVAAIGKLGDGILKVERMKMDTVKEVESMRIKMEVKRTEMMLEWQKKLLDLFSTTVMEKKKKVDSGSMDRGRRSSA